jgi:iron-sulfur cluster repair protein YtfE (RIC family)
MKTTELGVFDNNFCETDDASKILLFDEIVDHFLPLFHEDIRTKQDTLKSHQKDVEKLKTDITKTKQYLVTLTADYKKEALMKQILEECATLYSHEILYGNNKNIVIDILDSISDMNTSELASKLKVLRSMVYKNVNRVQTN